MGKAVGAIQNKIRPFLTNTNMRAMVSQPGRSLAFRPKIFLLRELFEADWRVMISGVHCSLNVDVQPHKTIVGIAA